MPIKDRKRRRLIRLGIIRLGYLEERKRKDGSTYTFPRQSDHFLLHDAPEIAEFYAAQGIEEVKELDVLLRNGLSEVAKARADAAILREGIGLSRSDCRLLRKAAETLRRRRYSRSSVA